MGRPSIPVKSIVVDSDGTLLVWTDGLLSGNKDLIKEVNKAADLGAEIPITPFGPVVKADLSNNENLPGVLAALTAANCGRTRLLHAPDELIEILPLSPDDENLDEISAEESQNQNV